MSFEKPVNNQEENVLSMEDFRKSHEKILEAKEIMGEDFLGRREVEKALGIKIDAEKIPEIPFSKEELERARELNQFLILRVDRTADGRRLTIENINKILKGKLKDEKKLLYFSDLNGHIRESSWFKKDSFATEEVPRLSWALSNKNIIPDSNNKNCIEQFQVVANYIEDEVFKEKEIPKIFRESIEEFNDKKKELEDLLKTDWKKVVRELETLKISRISRPNSSELVYDLCIYYQNNNEKLFDTTSKNVCTSTTTDSDIYFVKAGSFGQYGMDISYLSPEVRSPSIGSTFSRTI